MTDGMDARIREAAESLSAALSASGKTLSAAESFTGGNVTAAIVSVPGASKFLREGIVSYSVMSKEYRLGVEKATLDRYGAVSERTVREMIRGLMDSPLKPDFAVATTGNAGPGREKGSEDGVCYVAAGDREEVVVRRFVVRGERRDNIAEGTLAALVLLNEIVNKPQR